MGADDRMMRSNKKFCRCCVPGHSQERCGIIDEIRPAPGRAFDKRKWKEEADRQISE